MWTACFKDVSPKIKLMANLRSLTVTKKPSKSILKKLQVFKNANRTLTLVLVVSSFFTLSRLFIVAAYLEECRASSEILWNLLSSSYQAIQILLRRRIKQYQLYKKSAFLESYKKIEKMQLWNQHNSTNENLKLMKGDLECYTKHENNK